MGQTLSISTPEAPARDAAFARLLQQIRRCRQCEAKLPLGPRPVVRGLPTARLLIISQAPGTRVHETGLSFNDRSGDRLRCWLGIDRTVFYDESRVALMPMGFCYPGRAARGGDRPPRPECAPLWHAALRPHFAAAKLTLLVGGYAIRHYLPQTRRDNLGAILGRWRDHLPDYFVLPHPSWRAALWERANPWFLDETIPQLQATIGRIVA